jgi:hypothetical protein
MTLKFDSTTLSPPAAPAAGTQWTLDAEGLYQATVSQSPLLGTHTVKIISSGNLGSAVPGSTAAVDESKLADILLRVKFRVLVTP